MQKHVLLFTIALLATIAFAQEETEEPKKSDELRALSKKQNDLALLL